MRNERQMRSLIDTYHLWQSQDAALNQIVRAWNACDRWFAVPNLCMERAFGDYETACINLRAVGCRLEHRRWNFGLYCRIWKPKDGPAKVDEVHIAPDGWVGVFMHERKWFRGVTIYRDGVPSGTQVLGPFDTQKEAVAAEFYTTRRR